MTARANRIVIVVLAALLLALAWWLLTFTQAGCDPLTALPWLRCTRT